MTINILLLSETFESRFITSTSSSEINYAPINLFVESIKLILMCVGLKFVDLEFIDLKFAVC